jgi:hypothetical protein
MTSEELLHHVEPGTTLLVRNDAFDYAGKAEVTLDGGDVVYWLFAEDGSFVSVNPQTDEMVDFWTTGEELEREEEEPDVVGYQGENFELSYHDRASVTKVVGEVPVDEGEVYVFQDFENDDGELVRILQNEASGDEQAFTGGILIEEHVAVVED